MDEAQQEVLKHVAETMGTSEARLYEQVNSSFNWVLATLFASNGGALVALVGADAKLPAGLPLGLFAAGVLFSISMGIANAVYATRAILPITDLRMTIALLAAGQAEPNDLQTKMDALNDFKWLKSWLYASGAISFGCLVGGMIAYAVSR